MTIKKKYVHPEIIVIEMLAESSILAESIFEVEVDSDTTLPGSEFNSKDHGFSIWDDDDE
ncbi:MAG: hypothetical protein OSJ56_00805 [Prevotella sp.]|uniref:hypothetical protein n=1 Tax=Prevotella sp. PTAC TaxID=2736295 RepID=UPI0015573A88|nr:hypothetical protein [Prevotella sp. PTAC]MCX4292583.1 hypothetical protein [Prevotella sp.]NPD53582.1 hypothetical protein [Prevotella sp. PTAC]